MSINQQVSAKECDVLANANAKAFPLVIAINMEKNNADASKHSSLEKQQFVQFGDISSRNEMNDVNYTKELHRTKLYIEKLRRKLDLSQRKYKRLQEKATSLAFLVKQLQDKQLK